jgi:hypothetical protein
MTRRTYTDLIAIPDFLDRYRYLSLRSPIGVPTFGYDRYLNQAFYTSAEWRQLRNHVIARDRGCDLGLDEYPINWRPSIHHMNPMTVEGVVHRDEDILDPEFLITVSHRTHNAIHFGDVHLLAEPMTVRRPGDTKLW